MYRIPGINRMDIDILTSHTIGLDLIICHKIGEKILVSTDDVIMTSSLGATLRNIVFLNPRYFNSDLAPLRVKSGLFAGHISKDNCLSFQKIPKDLLFDPCKPEISRDQNRDFS